MRIERRFCAIGKDGERDAFSMKPVRDLLKGEMAGGLWIDPTGRPRSPAQRKNGKYPEVSALDYLRTFGDGEAAGVLFDPTVMDSILECKAEIARILHPGGKAVCIEWGSSGIGRAMGFEIVRILLVCHGGIWSDTIVTVDRKAE